MKSCLRWLFCCRSQSLKVEQQSETSHFKRKPGGMSVHYDRSNMNITIQSEEPVIQSLNGVLINTLGPSPSSPVGKPRAKPKIYTMGKTTVCRTPSVEPPLTAKLKSSKLSKGVMQAPKSALLLPDIEAKKELMRLKLVRSHTEERPRSIESEM